MPTATFPDQVLISSPDGGGLLFVSSAGATIVDPFVTTGLCIYPGGLARCAFDGDNWSLRLINFDGEESIVQGLEIPDAHDVFYFDSFFYIASSGTNTIYKVSVNGVLEQTFQFPGTQDAWHLNCIASVDGRIAACAFGEFSEHRGYKGHSLNSGFIFDLESGRKLWTGLSQPHTPVQDGERMIVCDSETKRLLVRHADGETRTKEFDGYIRGIAIGQECIYLGISCSRNINTSAYSQTAKLVALNKYTLDVVNELNLPFPEVYSIIIVRSDLIPTVLGLAAKSSTTSFFKIRELRKRLNAAERAELELRRLNSHPIVGRILRLLRVLKRDKAFGALQK